MLLMQTVAFLSCHLSHWGHPTQAGVHKNQEENTAVSVSIGPEEVALMKSAPMSE